MKYGIRNSSLDMDWEGSIEAAGCVGYDGVELVIGSKENLINIVESDADRILELCRDSGIQVCSLSVGPFREYNFSLDIDMETSISFVELSIAACEALGAEAILLPHFDREKIDLGPKGEERYVRGLKRCAPAAEREGVNIGIETSFSYQQLKRMVREVGSNHVGIYQDLANNRIYGHDPLEMTEILSPWIVMIHIKELEGDLLGEGEMDWPRNLSKIGDIGYDGWLVLETKSTDNPIEAAEINLDFLKRGIEADF